MLKSIKKISRKHYIQCLMTVLLTGIVLYFTSELWINKNIIVSFNAKAEKDIQYQVYYTEDKGQAFNEEQSIKHIIKSKSKSVKIVLPIKNIVSFRLDIGNNPGKVEISDMKIVGAKVSELDYAEFERRNIDEYKILNDKLFITSSHDDPYIFYKKKINILASMNIDWCRLIVISVLSFLLMFKFVQYLSKYKIEKHYSRIDIVMLTVFFVLLFVPMSHISDAEKSMQENRMLAKKPQLMVDNRGGGNYGVQFDAWYNDHFFGRDAMIYMYNYLKFKIAPMTGNNKVVVGNNDWLFLKIDNGMNNYANITQLTADEMKNGLKYLSDINEWCQKHNKRFYYVIAPDKSKIYGEYYRLVKKNRSDENGIGYQFESYINKNSDIKVLYLRDELIKNKDKGILYYKHDTHWNSLGAYYGYKSLMKLMNFPSKSYEFTENRRNGDLEAMVNNIINADNERYKTPKLRYMCRTEGRNVVCENPKENLRLFILKDSFTDALLPYLGDSFNKVYTYHYGDFNFSEEQLKFIENNADIVILENVERFIPIILNKKFPQNLIMEN